MPEEASKVKHYRERKVWQKGRLLVKCVYELTARFPKEERYGLVAQMRRAAVSVPSNIAEGQARQGTGEFLMFLSHASGSLAELDTQLLLSVDLAMASDAEIRPCASLIEELQRMLSAMRRSLQRNRG